MAETITFGNRNIVTSGFVGVGTTSQTTSMYQMAVGGSIGATGDVFTFYSDERLKTKTGGLTGALDKVCSLEGFTYVPNELAKEIGACSDSLQRVGVSAQKLKEVLPEAVGAAAFNPEYMTVQYDKVVPLLIEAIKELNSKLEYVQSKLR